MPLANRLGAEFFGTFWLVLGGCGSAVLAAAFPDLGIGFLGMSLAFGPTVVTMAYSRSLTPNSTKGESNDVSVIDVAEHLRRQLLLV
jgi:glycerol uptake facilitator-like aquaporin